MANSSSLAAQNKAALDYFVQTPVTREMVTYLASKASEVIRCDQSPPSPAGELPTPPTTPPHDASDPTLPPLEAFITSIIQQSHVQVPTLMPALIYLARLKERLPPVAQGIPSTVHRIFLAALILAAKNLNDSSPKNKHWARYTSVPGYPLFSFTNSEVNLMEKQLLYLLDWNMQITNEDLYFHLEPFLAPIRVKQAQRAEKKMQALLREREREQAQLRQQQQHRARQQSISALTCSSQINLPHIVAQARQHSYSASRDVYDSPASASTTYSASTTDSPAYASSTYDRNMRSRSESLAPPSLTHSRSSSRAPTTRTPSLSPPTRCDSLASYSSSTCGTPAESCPYPAKPEEAKCAMPAHPVVADMGYGYNPYGAQGRGGYTYMHHDIPEVVHIQVPKPLPAPVSSESYGIQKPLPVPATAVTGKRLRSTGTSIFSRFMGGGNGNGVSAVQSQA